MNKKIYLRSMVSAWMLSLVFHVSGCENTASIKAFHSRFFISLQLHGLFVYCNPKLRHCMMQSCMKEYTFAEVTFYGVLKSWSCKDMKLDCEKLCSKQYFHIRKRERLEKASRQKPLNAVEFLFQKNKNFHKAFLSRLLHFFSSNLWPQFQN